MQTQTKLQHTYNHLTMYGLIKLMQKWKQTPPYEYKAVIQHLCKKQGITKEDIQMTLKASYSKAESIINPAHKARIEFVDALNLARLLDCDIRDFLSGWDI